MAGNQIKDDKQQQPLKHPVLYTKNVVSLINFKVML